MSNRRPDPNVPSKYENHLPVYLEDFFVYFLKDQEGGGLEDWQEELVDEMYNGLVERIQKQMKESSRSRKMFVAMNPEMVWENEAEMIMRITRRNLATFDKPFIKVMDDYIKEVLRSRIDPIRVELRGITRAVLASDEETTAVAQFCSGDTFFFEDLAQHLVEQDAWRAELFQRFPCIHYIRQREEFLLDMIKFDEGDRNSSAKGNTIESLNKAKKYRNNAARSLVEGNEVVHQLIDEYQSNYQKAFEIKGVVYQHKLEEQDACIANVVTNFSAFKRELLVLHVPATDSIEGPVVAPEVEDLLSDPEFYTPPQFVDYNRF